MLGHQAAEYVCFAHAEQQVLVYNAEEAATCASKTAVGFDLSAKHSTADPPWVHCQHEGQREFGHNLQTLCT